MILIIEEYVPAPAAYLDWDPQTIVIAKRLIEIIESREKRLRVEHIGSTAVPGCGGKGYIDLLICYEEGSLEQARAVLDDLGFQRQSGREPFPEDRPMRVGSVVHNGSQYQIHAHVVAAASEEVRDLLVFRDRLRADIELRAAYEAEKRRIISLGISDPTDYALRKTAFIRRVVNER